MNENVPFLYVLRDYLLPEQVDEWVALASTLTFIPGRQGTGYEKVSVLDAPMMAALVGRSLDVMGLNEHCRHDCWILRFPENSYTPPHKDPVPEGLRHYRLNVLLVAAKGGDVEILNHETVKLRTGDAYLFRPDIMEHTVRPVTNGTRLVLSIGAAV